VTSTPRGAIVVLDAREVGKTPLTIKVPPGIHRITVVQSGYASITRTLTVRSGPVSLNVNLTATR
jgi:hypothetical protein